MPRVGSLHALSLFEPVVQFANAVLTEQDFVPSLFCFVTPSKRRAIENHLRAATPDRSIPYRVLYKARDALKAGARCGFAGAPRPGKPTDHPAHDVWCVLRWLCPLAGKRIDYSATVQLQHHLRAGLVRYLKAPETALASGSGAGSDFIIRGRRPFEKIEWMRADDGNTDPLTADLQDVWYAYLSHLVAKSEQVRGGRRPRGSRPFRELAQCEASGCPRFFFRPTRRRRACSPECSDRLRRRRSARSTSPRGG